MELIEWIYMILFIYIIYKSCTYIWFISVVYKNLVVVQSMRLDVSAVPIFCWTLVWADTFRVTDFQASMEPSPSNRWGEFASRSENEQVKGKGFFLQSPLMWATARSYSSDFERVIPPQIIWLWHPWQEETAALVFCWFWLSQVDNRD